jgi:Phosphate-starvation-inducible E family
MSRKFAILDLSAMPAATIAALAAVTLVLGAVYWLLQDQGAQV